MVLPSTIQKILFPTRYRVDRLSDRMEHHMSRITQTLLAINDQLNKAAQEITSKIAELETRDYLTDEDHALLSHIKVGAQTLDDIVPDEVVEEAEAEEAAEEEAYEEEAPAEEDDESDESEDEAVDPTEPAEDTEA